MGDRINFVENGANQNVPAASRDRVTEPIRRVWIGIRNPAQLFPGNLVKKVHGTRIHRAQIVSASPDDNVTADLRHRPAETIVRTWIRIWYVQQRFEVLC